MRGTYTIVLSCRKPMMVRFGKLGYAKVGVGYHLYTGSALGRGAVSIEGRIMRHKRRSKKPRWHVDYLTMRPECRFRGAVYLISGERLECRINHAICDGLHLQPDLLHVGASDCGCEGHLVGVTRHLNESKLLGVLERVYLRFGVPHFF